MIVNPYFEQTVRIQNDRKHKVITGGPYKIVRHQAMAYYREKRTTMLKLVTACKIAGICFIVNGVAVLFTRVFSASGAWDPLLSFVGVLLNFAVGFSGVYIPIYFKLHVTTWGERLQEIVKVEKDLAKLMEGN